MQPRQHETFTRRYKLEPLKRQPEMLFWPEILFFIKYCFVEPIFSDCRVDNLNQILLNSFTKAQLRCLYCCCCDKRNMTTECGATSTSQDFVAFPKFWWAYKSRTYVTDLVAKKKKYLSNKQNLFLIFFRSNQFIPRLVKSTVVWNGVPSVRFETTATATSPFSKSRLKIKMLSKWKEH